MESEFNPVPQEKLKIIDMVNEAILRLGVYHPDLNDSSLSHSQAIKLLLDRRYTILNSFISIEDQDRYVLQSFRDYLIKDLPDQTLVVAQQVVIERSSWIEQLGLQFYLKPKKRHELWPQILPGFEMPNAAGIPEEVNPAFREFWLKLLLAGPEEFIETVDISLGSTSKSRALAARSTSEYDERIIDEQRLNIRMIKNMRDFIFSLYGIKGRGDKVFYNLRKQAEQVQHRIKGNKTKRKNDEIAEEIQLVLDAFGYGTDYEFYEDEVYDNPLENFWRKMIVIQAQ